MKKVSFPGEVEQQKESKDKSVIYSVRSTDKKKLTRKCVVGRKGYLCRKVFSSVIPLRLW